MYSFLLEDIKGIEKLLNDMGAEGNTLHQKIDSVRNRIDSKYTNKLRWISTIRSKILYGGHISIDTTAFERAIEETNNYLSHIAPPK
ncbi:hypothetical protein ID964_004482 [Salmonella enterica]|nr:hypothetical protein [Salmonella enterica]